MLKHFLKSMGLFKTIYNCLLRMDNCMTKSRISHTVGFLGVQTKQRAKNGLNGCVIHKNVGVSGNSSFIWLLKALTEPNDSWPVLNVNLSILGQKKKPYFLRAFKNCSVISGGQATFAINLAHHK